VTMGAGAKSVWATADMPVEKDKEGGDLAFLVGHSIVRRAAFAVEDAVEFQLADVIPELRERVRLRREAESLEDGSVQVAGAPSH
jgi:hypothetical protein